MNRAVVASALFLAAVGTNAQDDQQARRDQGVASRETNLVMVRGVFSQEGGASTVVSGSGFTLTHLGNNTTYVTFTYPFFDTPAITSSAEGSPDLNMAMMSPLGFRVTTAPFGAKYGFTAVGKEATQDLLVAELSSTVPTVLNVGDTFQVTDRTRNIGNSRSEPSQTRYTATTCTNANNVWRSSTAFAGSRSVQSLAPGNSATGTITLTVLPSTNPPGNGNNSCLMACADAPGTVYEGPSLSGGVDPEANNCRVDVSRPFTFAGE